MLRPGPRSIRGLVAVLGAVALSTAAAGCGGGDATSSDLSTPLVTSASPTDVVSSGSPTASGGATYLPAPPGVDLTQPGTTLPYGQGAVVAFEPRQSEVLSLYLTVAQVREGAAKRALRSFQLDRSQARSTALLVKVKVANAGTTETSGVGLPLYAHTSAGTLVAATAVPTRFTGCKVAELPSLTVPKQIVQRCLLFLVPEGQTLSTIDFRASSEVPAIAWLGAAKPIRAKDTTLAPETSSGGTGGKNGGKGSGKKSGTKSGTS